MQITAMVAEILVIGVLTLCPLAIFLLGLFNITPDYLVKTAQIGKDFLSLSILIVLSLAYQLGWLTNSISLYIAKYTFMKRVRSAVLGDRLENYALMRDTIYLEASDNAVTKIKERLFGVRLLRTGVINFFLLSISLVSIHQYLLAFLVAIFVVLLSITTYTSYHDYVERIYNTYRRIENRS